MLSWPRRRRASTRPSGEFRVIALLAAYNEARFMDACLSNLVEQGVDFYLIDNESTDETVEIAERYRGRGLVGIEPFPRDGVWRWDPILERKDELARELDADWFIHADPDEMRLPPPRSGTTLAEALLEADRLGYNAVNFQEYTFVPTREAPDHDHPRFFETMRWYYPFAPTFPHRLNAWKRRRGRVKLAPNGGHRVAFRGLRMYPESFAMRHYLVLSLAHATEKYLKMKHDPKDVAKGKNVARARLAAHQLVLPSEADLRPYTGDDSLDATEPLSRHLIFGG
jgi:glycosyl transferase family 2